MLAQIKQQGQPCFAFSHNKCMGGFALANLYGKTKLSVSKMYNHLSNFAHLISSILFSKNQFKNAYYDL